MDSAWLTERRILEAGIPVVLSNEEQTWSDMFKVEAADDLRTATLWESHVPGSYAQEKLMYGAVQSMENMGYDVSSLLPLLAKGDEALAAKDYEQLHLITADLLMKMFNDLPVNPQSDYHKYRVYETFEQYAQSVSFPADAPVDMTSAKFLDQMHAGWQAQIVGGAVGTALEGYTYENILATFGQVHDYVRTPNTMNDDITFEIAFLLAFEQAGYKVTSRDIALRWKQQIPGGWSAEEIALKNLALGIAPPLSGYQCNPFREWIGAQMRGAICGMVAPGMPGMAAELAWKDAVVSHHNNGVLGEVFNALLVSLAFVEKDMRTIVKQCVDLMPADSEYHHVVSFALQQCLTNENWLDAWKACDAHLVKYNWVHAYPNAAAQVIALWYGNGDFEQTLHVIAMAGMDVDCNAAQILTALGIIHGTGAIDSRWTSPIGDKLDTYLRGYKQMSIYELAKRTVQAAIVARKLNDE